MAGQRTVTSTILRPDGSPWAGVEVRFKLLDDTFTLAPDATYPSGTLRPIVESNGNLQVTLASGTNSAYRVTLPNGEEFDILVPDGAATTLETLRADYLGIPGGTPSIFQPLSANLSQLAALTDPNADKLVGWDDSASALIYFTLGSGLTTVGTTISASGGSGGSVSWGSIAGTLSSQADLNTALNLKAPLASPTFTGTVTLPANQTLTTPTIASFTNAQHPHQSAAGGGTLSAAAITAGTMATARLGSGSATSGTFLRGDSTWATPAGSGDVVGPASSIDNAIVRMDNTTGKLIQSSDSILDDFGGFFLSGSAPTLQLNDSDSVTGSSGAILFSRSSAVTWELFPGSGANPNFFIYNEAVGDSITIDGATNMVTLVEGLTVGDATTTSKKLTLGLSGISAATTRTWTAQDVSGTVYVSGGTDILIADGGTGQSSAQAAINALSAVAGATNEYVLTKDTASGNAIWKVSAGGGGGSPGGSDSHIQYNNGGAFGGEASLAWDDTAKIWKLGTGDSAIQYVTNEGKRGRVYDGTAASPDLTYGSTFKVSRTMAMPRTQIDANGGGDGNEGCAAILGIAKGTAANQVQPIGVLAHAYNLGEGNDLGGTGNDACAIYATGRVGGNSVGVAIGAAIYSRRDNDTSKYTSMEISAINNGTTDTTYGSGGFSSCAIWMTPGGTPMTGVGLLIGNIGARFDVGIGFNGQVAGGHTGSVLNADIRTDDTSITVLDVNGSHTNILDMDGATATNAVIYPDGTIQNTSPHGTSGETVGTYAILSGPSTAGNDTVLTLGQGTLASGDWAIYSATNRDSFHNGSFRVGAGVVLGFQGRSQTHSPADGTLTYYNSALTDFTQLQFGGVTASFPSIKRSSTAMVFRLADDSGPAPINALLFGAGSATAGSWPKRTSGTLLTTPEAGAEEYDGAVAYFTNETTGGRGNRAIEQRFKLDADGSAISTIANFFGATSNIPLVANAYYEIDIELHFLKTTANSVTITLTNSAAPTSQDIYWESSPIAGIVAPPGTATNLFGNTFKDTTAAKAITTGTLATGVDHFINIRLILRNGTGTSLTIKATANTSGTITPRAGSRWVCKRVPAANVSAYAA